MSEEMKKLVRQRATCRSQITNCEKFATNPPSDDSQAVISKCEVKLSMLDSHFKTFEDIQAKIEDLVTEDQIETERKTRQDIEDQYCETKTLIKCMIAKLTPKSTKNEHESKSNDEHDEFNLPKINVPIFTGKSEEWTSWRDLFDATVTQSKKLNDSKRHYYLRTYVDAEPLSLIKDLPLTGKNYAEAWKILENRYANPQLIISTHLSKIFSVQKCDKDNVSSLKQLVDTIQTNLRAMVNLNLTRSTLSDAMMAFLITDKLDNRTRELWEDEKADIEDENLLDQLFKFLNKRVNTLTTISKGSSSSSPPSSSTQNRSTSNTKTKSAGVHKVTVNAENSPPVHRNCLVCNGNHPLYRCRDFIGKTVEERFEAIKNSNICYNCFRVGHSAKRCTNEYTCKTCHKKHNTLLHSSSRDLGEKGSSESTPKKEEPKDEASSTQSQVAAHISTQNPSTQVLLATVSLLIVDSNGIHQKARALLDPGAQANLISENLVQKLKLPTKPIAVKIDGVACVSSNVRASVRCSIASRTSDFKSTLNALVVSKVTSSLPSVAVPTDKLQLAGKVLADPEFHKPGEIDLLLNAEYFLDIFLSGHRAQTNTSPGMRETVFGWIISGKAPTLAVHVETTQVNHCAIPELLEKFWNIEELNDPITKLTAEEQACEEHFLSTTTREPNGRFKVRLPFKTPPDLKLLGESRNSATRLLNYTMSRLKPDTLKQYHAFMNEYIELGHMVKIENPRFDVPHIYIPHHPVIREESITTKLRVVFNGSKPTSTGVTVNSLLKNGKSLQSCIFFILLRWRCRLIAIICDIVKMYRQIMLHEDDQDFQRIRWFDDNRNLADFRLATLTYGFTSSAYQAIRCLVQLAKEEMKNFPIAAVIVLEEFFMDDGVTGAESVEEAKSVVQQLIDLMQRGAFQLRKWATNEPAILSVLPKANDEALINKSEEVGVLGVTWSTKTDQLQISVQFEGEICFTKRAVLSEIASIFDPLGLAAPVTIVAKIFLQSLWKTSAKWDDNLLDEQKEEWQRLRADLCNLMLIVPRIMCEGTSLEIHGFCDASSKAYCACIYIRSKHNDKVNVTLACAKTRVSPIKQESIARLELLGALLLAKLVEKVLPTLLHQPSSVNLWCDSQIALAWIAKEPAKWKTFVRNRVHEIQKRTNSNRWRYVPTKLNPADLGSRGISSEKLNDNQFWLKGPPFLLEEPVKGPNSPSEPMVDDEDVIYSEAAKPKPHVLVTTEPKEKLFERTVDFNEAKRCVAYWLRFFSALNKKNSCEKGQISAKELKASEMVLVKIAQNESFPKDIRRLKKKGQVSKRSRLLELAPFLDEAGIIRVGGRLGNADLIYQQKHPPILCAKHPLAKDIVRQIHLELNHPPKKLLLATLRERYWIVGVSSLAKFIARSCITCCKANAKIVPQQMGQLPKERVTSAFSFENVGVDFGGPFMINVDGIRNRKATKNYICAFVCLATKAVHLEVATELSTDGFLRAFSRFVSRRGRPTLIMSDNGTNFRGAANEMNRICAETRTQNRVADEGIEWKFIPPGAPNFGGLWEAVIKSTKTYLTKVIGDQILNLEEFITVLDKIEAFLNSRPLGALSDDPRDLEPLTPAHFLIGRPLTAEPMREAAEKPRNLRLRLLLIQQITQSFWKQWSKNYVTTLQTRNKWRNPTRNLVPGDLVLVKDDNFVQNWKLGRIVDVFPGQDQLVRVADIRCKDGVMKRPVSKIAFLMPTTVDEID